MIPMPQTHYMAEMAHWLSWSKSMVSTNLATDSIVPSGIVALVDYPYFSKSWNFYLESFCHCFTRGYVLYSIS